MRLRKTIIFVILFSMLFSVYSCKHDEQKGPDLTASKEEPNETKNEFDFTPESKTIVVWQEGTDPEDPLVVSFCRDNPDYTVDNSTAVTWGFDLDRTKDLPRLAGALAANKQPDLFKGYMTPIEAYYSDLFMPMHDFLVNDPEYNINTIEPIMFDAVTFNDKIYFALNGYSVPVLIWNKVMFENAGIDPNKPPKTWSELKEYNEKLLTYDSNGKISSIGITNNGVYLDWKHWHTYATGEIYTDKSGLKFNLDTPSYNRTFEFIRSFSDPYGGNDKVPAGTPTAMGLGGTSAFYIWLMFNNNAKFGIAELPRPDDVTEEYVPGYFEQFHGIPRNAKNPRGGWKYLKYLMTDAVYAVELQRYENDPNMYIPDYVTHIPTREKMYKEFKPYMSEDFLQVTEIRDEIMQKVNVMVHNFAVEAEFFNYYRPEYDKVMNNQISPKEFLANAQSYVDQFIAEFIIQKKNDGWIFNEDGTAIPPSLQEQQ